MSRQFDNRFLENGGLENAVDEERKRVRRLRFLMDLTISRLYQEPMARDEALALVESARRMAMTLFPGREFQFELIYRPRMMRVIRERWPEAAP